MHVDLLFNTPIISCWPFNPEAFMFGRTTSHSVPSNNFQWFESWMDPFAHTLTWSCWWRAPTVNCAPPKLQHSKEWRLTLRTLYLRWLRRSYSRNRALHGPAKRQLQPVISSMLKHKSLQEILHTETKHVISWKVKSGVNKWVAKDCWPCLKIGWTNYFARCFIPH